MDTENTEPKASWLLVEYQAAQDSAQHHDNLLWNTTGAVWAAELVALGFAVQQLGTVARRPTVLAVGFIAILMLLYEWIMALQFRSVKNQKYKRCKQIEAILHLEQHTKLNYFTSWGSIVYAFVVLSFLSVWGFVLCAAFDP